MSVEDYDADGHIDIMVVDVFSDDFAILRGLGDGTFKLEGRYGAPDAPVAAVSGDLDGDERVDLVVAARNTMDIMIFGNQGPFPNQAPVASIKVITPAECGSPGGGELTLDGSGSSDADSVPGSNDDIESFEWFEDFGLPTERLVGSGQKLVVVLPLGPHSITLRVSDSRGGTSTETVLVSVIDTRAPSLRLSVSHPVLWPPNHRMVEIQIVADVVELCGPTTIILRSVVSSEPDGGAGEGDGNIDGDIRGIEVGRADFEFQLRAERHARDVGRMYIITYEAMDGSGNSIITSISVLVPHDRAISTESPAP